jgi:predicted enzyme related to lactoylglutathione lyase
MLPVRDAGAMAASLSVFLNVQDIERSISFYKGLGFKVDALHRGREGTGPVRYADLSYQGAELGLGHVAINDDPEFRAWVGTPLGAGVMLYFSVPDVDKLYEKAKAQGAVIEYAPEDRSYGRVFGLNDPDGYVVAFIKEKKAPVRKAATRATKAVQTVAKKVTKAKSPAAKSLAASRKQAAAKGATKKPLSQQRRSDKGLSRTR